MKKCDVWGGLHFGQNFAGSPFTSNKLGVYEVASACDGSFKMQAFQCPFNGGYGTVAIGIAMNIDGKRVVIIDGKGSVDGEQVKTIAPKGLSYAGSLTTNSRGVQVVSGSGCVRVNVNRRRTDKTLRPGWLHNAHVRIMDRSLDQASGLCFASTGVKHVPSDDPGQLFSFEQLIELCSLCKGTDGNGETPPNCFGLTVRMLEGMVDAAGPERRLLDLTMGSQRHEAAQTSRSTEQACSDQAAKLAEAQTACQLLKGNAFNYEGCLLDFCNSGGDAAVTENTVIEALRTPPEAASCTTDDGSSTSAFYPCMCSGTICNEGRICRTSGEVGSCTGDFQSCSDASGNRLSAGYPCLCGNVICDRGEACRADGKGDGFCFAACSTTDLSAASNQYPCTCGSDVCKQGEWCKSNSVTPCVAEAAARKANADAAALAKANADAKAKAAADAAARAQAAAKAQADAAAAAKASADAKAKAAMAAKAQADAVAIAKANVDAKARADAASKARAEAESAGNCFPMDLSAASSRYPCNCGSGVCKQGEWCGSSRSPPCLPEWAALAARASSAGAEDGPHLEIPVENIDCASLLANPGLKAQIKERAAQHFIEVHGIPKGYMRVEVACGSVIVKVYIDPTLPSSTYTPTVNQDTVNGYPQLKDSINRIPGIAGISTGDIFIKAQCSPSICPAGQALGGLRICAGARCTKEECCSGASGPTSTEGDIDMGLQSSPNSVKDATEAAMQSSAINDLLGMWSSTSRGLFLQLASPGAPAVLGSCLALVGAIGALFCFIRHRSSTSKPWPSTRSTSKPYPFTRASLVEEGFYD